MVRKGKGGRNTESVYGMGVRGANVVQRVMQCCVRGRCEVRVSKIHSAKNGGFGQKRTVSQDLPMPIALVRPQ